MVSRGYQLARQDNVDLTNLPILVLFPGMDYFLSTMSLTVVYPISFPIESSKLQNSDEDVSESKTSVLQRMTV